jgi:hypothetical protein
MLQGHSKVQAFTMKKLLKEHGLEAANSLAAFVKAQQYHMKDAVDRENLDCEFEMRRTYDVYTDEQDAKEAEELYRTAITEGHQWARDLDFVGGEFVEQVLLTFVHPSYHQWNLRDRSRRFKVQKLQSVCQHAASGPTSSSLSCFPN